jgi:hypothetical protein
LAYPPAKIRVSARLRINGSFSARAAAAEAATILVGFSSSPPLSVAASECGRVPLSFSLTGKVGCEGMDG